MNNNNNNNINKEPPYKKRKLNENYEHVMDETDNYHDLNIDNQKIKIIINNIIIIITIITT